ncbi:zinc-dependent metalloprotease [Natronoglycomyces albus]|uniref:Zinc-dependent metalloprotease n=2 Tax=Natronoglycomyces albus TaxID=2811108 RepID=A0A895XP82_9ACTN|nr:zinc-dependent metalloprotease [Natronoglycomyces albus]
MPDPNDPRMQQMMQQLQQMMSQSMASAGPVNWELAQQLAEGELAGEPVVGPAEQSEVAEALRLADLWLDSASAWPSGVTQPDAWTRKQWISYTEDSWKQMAEPLASQMGSAMGTLVPEGMEGLLGPMADLMKGVGSALFGAQMGQALSKLAAEVLSSTEVGLPLGKIGRAALLPANVAEYAQGLQLPVEEVRLFVALREAAHHRLFTHAPWLRSHVITLLQAYAREIRIDSDAVEEAMSGLDPSDPEAMQTMDLGKLFRPEDTEQQKLTLQRLETALALITGWVNVVVTNAVADRLPTLSQLMESAHRRRASGGPAEKTFEALVGLQMQPATLRSATKLWETMTEQHGVEGREAVWAHPDLMPTTDDLQTPEAYASMSGTMSELDMSIFDQLAVNDPPADDEDGEERPGS